MIHFITNEPKHIEDYTTNLYDNIEVYCDTDETFEIFKGFIDSIYDKLVGYDRETTGLDAWVHHSLLSIIGNQDHQFIIHDPYADAKRYMQYVKDKDFTLLGHNIKFDIKLLKTKENITYTKVFDTMITEQRLYMKSGLSSSLAQLAIRYLDTYPDAMDKAIREEFIGANPKTFKVLPKHLRYGAEDVVAIFPIKEKQEAIIDRYNLRFLLEEIEFPLVRIIAKAEITGFEFDSEKWTNIYKTNIENAFITECALDEEFRNLRNQYAKTSNLIYISGGKWDNIRKYNSQYDTFNADGTTNELDLFGEPMKINTLLGSKAKVPKKIQKAPNNINFGSDTQIIEIFGRLEEPVLTKEEQLIIPSFTKTHKVDKTRHSFTTSEPAFNTYLSLLPNSKMKKFIKILIDYRGLTKATSTYGLNFINNLNKVTGRLHTSFKQCFTATGRMASGGGKAEPDKPNFQNIPSKASYAIAMRNCFRARIGHSIITSDLSGAELIIMCSLSQDLKLLKIAQEDIHSYVAQGCWRLIYRSKAVKLMADYKNLKSQYGAEWKNPSLITQVNDFINKSKTFVVNKSKKALRTAFKPMTFGTIYGMYAGKAAKTLNISKEEGQIVINFIKSEFPDVFKMVEEASQFAKERGYIILNKRTNSRAWFPNLIKLLKGELNEKLHFGIISKELSEARNIKIQGTQADMIKEATVEIQKWIDYNNLEDEITILSWVHDEIVVECPEYLDGNSSSAWRWLQQGNSLTYNNIKYNSFALVKKQIMIDTCNKYLENVTMDVDYDVEPYWTK